jgi:phosphonate utilization transcriptional regulator
LQIVDNLHPASSNGNVLKPTSTRVRARAEGTAAAIKPLAQQATAAPGGTRAPRAVGDDHPIALLQTNSLPALVQREIERMILAGDLAAGAQLRETEVAAMLGVSRGPVREAFRALEESGLVRLEKNRGVFVRQISVEEADDIFELRAVLDEFAGRRAAQNTTAAEAAELKALVEVMESAVARGDVDGYHDANLAFHDRIVQLAGNPKLTLMYRRLVNELHLHRRAALGQAGILPVSINEHRAIVGHIASRQAAAAARALYEHAMASRERVHRVRGVAPPQRSRKPAR